MKTPCEIVVWYVLPTIRREMAKEMVDTYHMKQADVGRIFGVTDAAISQYLKKKRGGNEVIENSIYYPGLVAEIKKSVKAILDDASDMSREMCRVCFYVKNVGLLSEVYSQLIGEEAPKCAWGENQAWPISPE